MRTIGPVIEKADAFIISEIFNNTDNSVVYIGKDDREIINIKEKLSWLLPKQKILLYKAWDQIPYDNISQSKEIQTSRLETLYYLDSNKDEKIILLTTLNGIIQKTIQPSRIRPIQNKETAPIKSEAVTINLAPSRAIIFKRIKTP